MKHLLLVLTLAALSTPASAGTAFFSHERPCTGLVKQCVYGHLGSPYVTNVRCSQICPLTVQVPTTPSYAPDSDVSGGTAFFQFERPCDGLVRECVYDYLGDRVSAMVGCAELCPLSIRVRR